MTKHFKTGHPEKNGRRSHLYSNEETVFHTKLYEETESECNRLKVETKGWQKWFDSNREIFDKLFSTSPPIGTQKKKENNTTSSVSDTPNNSTEELKKEEGNEKTKSKDKKRKLRFIK